MKTFARLSVVMLICSISSAVDIIPRPEKVEPGKGKFKIGT